jgi:GNAT superfamily N-acetyltransferase
VRAATPADYPALQALYEGCRRHADWLPEHSRSGRDLAHDAYGERLWLAEDAAGRAQGFVGVWMPESFIHHLYVRQDVHRRGVARALLQALAREGVPRPWRLKCLCANREALAFYRHLGWQQTDLGVDDDGPWVQLQHTGATPLPGAQAAPTDHRLPTACEPPPP